MTDRHLLRRSRLASLAFVLTLAIGTTAGAQGFDVQQLRPGPSQRTNIFEVSQARILDNGAWELGLFLHYADSPLIYEPLDTDALDDIVANQLTADLTAAIGLGGVFEFGFAMPLVLLQQGDDLPVLGEANAPDPGFGIGDLRFVPTLNFFDRDTDESPGGAALSLAVPVLFPTGSDDAYQGDRSVRVEPRLLYDQALRGGTRLTLNAGYMVRSKTQIMNLEVDDSVTWGAGVSVPVNSSQSMHLLAEVTGDVVLSIDNLAAEETPVETLFGLRHQYDSGLMMQLGAGIGIQRGAGSPAWRAFFGLSYGKRANSDRDGDGIPNDDDACQAEAEDFDQFEDEDGCPDRDNDRDGIYDWDDQCPLEGEDFDDFDDQDGCPDNDDDQDGVADVDDQCRLDPEDIDGFEDEDGCPDDDNDHDAIVDMHDACPDHAEDIDGFEDADGCPDPDNDADGIQDSADACPIDREDFDGFEDEDGCPEEGTGVVQLTCEQIVIGDSVYFDSDSDTIQDRSFELLDQVAGLLRGASHVRRVRIEGHTDSQGDEDYNLDLSQRRADSVLTYLVEQGVEADRLSALGRGEQAPIAENSSRRGRAQNRRVEFHVVEQDSICDD